MAKKLKTEQKKARIIRYAILGFVLLVSTAGGLLHQYGGAYKVVTFDALCPFGGLEALYSLIFTGTFLKRTAASNIILLAAVILLAFVFRRTFCGNICPLGTLQELFQKLRGKFLKKRFVIPEKADKYLRYLKYLVMVFFLAATFRLGYLVIRPYDPWGAYHHLTSKDLFIEFPIGFAVLVAALIGSFLYDRFFCKYLCPMGAFLGIAGKAGFFRIKRVDATCIHCNLCTKACPVNIKVHELTEVLDAECISCNECVNKCPVENTLVITSVSGKKTIKPLTLTIITFAVFFSIIAIGNITGNFKYFDTLGKAESIEKFNPDNIKGSSTFRSVINATGIPESDFISEFGITPQMLDTGIKESGVEPSRVRDYIRELQAKAAQ
ncbi:MAG: 4Fe-4S binding protein [Spirochaetia bacterium]|jgi:polyferredoxin|nr:4Fe-4S binding protein [Spirochaetia bacterium]